MTVLCVNSPWISELTDCDQLSASPESSQQLQKRKKKRWKALREKYKFVLKVPV